MKIYVNERLVALHGGMVSQQQAVDIARSAMEEPVNPDEVKRVCTTWCEVRQQRDNALADSDFTQVTDSPLSNEQQQLWATYRQTLRNLPETFETPEQVIWPQRPA
ncbi:tail fiber assembly protein [Pseudoalteromonas rubra]|uniref:tail fiber assembly protein n=1 Tax=Pseudoalteromonas rubra TaxID=43658 RepID=UPI0006984EEA|nr:tail fiber assembly protein [Pseudoalteromonas rubra]